MKAVLGCLAKEQESGIKHVVLACAQGCRN